jgi:hypothetical protein
MMMTPLTSTEKMWVELYESSMRILDWCPWVAVVMHSSAVVIAVLVRRDYPASKSTTSRVPVNS